MKNCQPATTNIIENIRMNIWTFLDHMDKLVSIDDGYFFLWEENIYFLLPNNIKDDNILRMSTNRKEKK